MMSIPVQPEAEIDTHVNEGSIAAVAKELGVTFRTLRYYEERGLLKPIRLGTTRRYSATDVETLRLIRDAKRLGFSLTEIEATLARGSRVTTRDGFVRAHVDHIEDHLLDLREKRADLDWAIAEIERILSDKDA